MKTCSTCSRSLDVTEFNVRARSTDGRQSVCRECNAARARRYYAENLEKHRRAVAAQVAKTRAAHLQRIGEYLAKCDVRCRNCHAIVTYERMGATWRSSLVRAANAE